VLKSLLNGGQLSIRSPGRTLPSEETHGNDNRAGSAESGPITITLEIVGPVDPIFGPTGPNTSIVIVFNINRARPGPLLLLYTFLLRTLGLQRPTLV
jgi:hypothetical protein